MLYTVFWWVTRQPNSLNLVSLWFEQLDDSLPLDDVTLQQECLGDRTYLWWFTKLLLLVLTILED